MNGKRARYLRRVMSTAPSLPKTKRVYRMLKDSYIKHGGDHYIVPFVQRVENLTKRGII